MKRYKPLFGMDEEWKTKYETDEEGNSKPVRSDDEEDEKEEACSKKTKKKESTELEESTGDFDKATDRWYDDLVDISERHFEKNKPVPELYYLLQVAEKYRPYGMQGTTTKKYNNFVRDIMKLRMDSLKRFQNFLKDTKPGDYDSEFGDDDLSYKEFGLWSNDKRGNASVVNSIIDLFSQGISYFGRLEDY